MLFVAIILAAILVYLLNFREPTPVQDKHRNVRRVGGVFAYNDMFDPSHDVLPTNTVTGPGGGSLLKKYV